MCLIAANGNETRLSGVEQPINVFDYLLLPMLFSVILANGETVVDRESTSSVCV